MVVRLDDVDPTDLLAESAIAAGFAPDDEEWPRMLAAMHPPQRAFASDARRWICALAGRRAGKSVAVAYWLLRGWRNLARRRSVYIARTIGHARDILWDVLRDLDRRWQLGARFNETRLEMTLPNGYQIRLRGAENVKQAEKIRGPHYWKAAIDECHTFPDSLLRHLVVRVLQPALIDHMGHLCLIGTPGYDLSGLWFEKSLDADAFPDDARKSGFAQWPTHRWTCLENPFLPDPEGEIAELRAKNGWDDDHPDLIREIYGRWVKDEDALVYPYQPGRNDYGDEDEPWPVAGPGVQVNVGVDIGWEDGCGFAVTVKLVDSPLVRVAVAYSLPGLTDPEIAAEIQALQERFDTSNVYVDSKGNKITAMTLQAYNVPAVPAVGGDKRPKIEYVRGLLKSGCLKAHETDASELVAEWQSLPWGYKVVAETGDRVKVGHREGFFDECSDAVINAAIMHDQRWGKARELPPRGTPQWDAYVEDRDYQMSLILAEKRAGKRKRRSRRLRELVRPGR